MNSILSAMVDAMEPLVQAVNSRSYTAEELYYALNTPNDAQCRTCGQEINHFHGHQGWQHWRTVPNPEFGTTKTELFEPEDGHRPEPRWKPRQRPDIVGGVVQDRPSEERTVKA